MTFPYRPLHMDTPVLAEKQKRTLSCCVRILEAIQKSYQDW